MGLKQMIDKAMQGDAESVANLPPVQVSGEAHRAYAMLMRKWSGWDNATLKFGDPGKVSPFASCNRITHVVTANPERLLLNPNRVLLTVNPFRLRQEAVLTGALLHEASHARHSNWIPRTEIDALDFKHADGSEITKAEMTLAKCLEEPRVEGIVAAEASKIGADGLGWTLRASAAHLVPMTALSADPDQAVMDLVGSWALRAGRQLALAYHTGHISPQWVQDFTTLLHSALTEHLIAHYGITEQGRVATDVNAVLELLTMMCRGTVQSAASMFADDGTGSDTGTFMIDHAKGVLTLLFPETPPNQMPSTGGSCGAGEGEKGDGAAQGVSDLGEDGEGNSEPDDEGSGDEAGEGDSGGQGTDEGEGQPDKPCDTESALAKALAAVEAQAKTEAVEQGKADATATDQTGGLVGRMGSGAAIGGGWRMPTPEERSTEASAEKFLRDLIEPSVASKIRVTDQPSSMIDGAALAAWKTGGQVKAPRFFQQVKRTIKPTPPVKIAVLVDVSASMDVLQKPSALLSWALAAACLDLRNYAGGGVMIESTLIHWGSSARVIQRNGEILPGIREVGCHDGTDSMHKAYELIAEQIPDFFDVTEQPENKLIVQFTDWKLAPHSVRNATEWVGKGLEAGATLLSVVPGNYSGRHSSLPGILAECKIQRGRNHILRYDREHPQAVWATASKALS